MLTLLVFWTLVVFYLGGPTLACLAQLSKSPDLQQALKYGRSLVGASDGSGSKSDETSGARNPSLLVKALTAISNLTVQKYMFYQYYVVGVLFNLPLLFILLWKPESVSSMLQPFNQNSTFKTLSWTEVKIIFILLNLQMIRRLYEHLFVLKPSSARMNIAHYLLGMVYYIITPTALIMEGIGNLPSNNDNNVSPPPTSIQEGFNLNAFHGIGICIFFWGFTEQYLAHAHLASLRPGQSTTVSTGRQQLKSNTASKGIQPPPSPSPPTYVLPKARYFQLVACPHYFFEMVIYFGIWSVSGFQSVLGGCLVYWVLALMGAQADLAYEWYKSKFGQPSNKTDNDDTRSKIPNGWKRMIPYLW